MFPTSTQRRYWMFSGEEELNRLRASANEKYIQRFGADMPDNERLEHFLTADEERIMVRRYEQQLREFCKRFQPPMIPTVVGTANHYFKRFYINNSVMDYHPKEIMVTCIFLACKVDEFNVSMQQFVANIEGDRDKATDIILNNEMLLMEQMNFHLLVHNPFRPVEGLLIDIKARSTLNDPERLRPGIEHFLELAFTTDVVLLYAPSQIALAAILHAASKLQENLDSYVTDTLFGEDGADKLKELIESVRAIRSMVEAAESAPEIPRVQQKALDKKLDKCRNPQNNPDSDIYKQRMQMNLNDDSDLYATLSDNTEHQDNSTLNIAVAESP